MLAAFGLALLFLMTSLFTMTPSAGLLFGCGVASWASVLYVLRESDAEDDTHTQVRPPPSLPRAFLHRFSSHRERQDRTPHGRTRRIVGGAVFAALILSSAYGTSQITSTPSIRPLSVADVIAAPPPPACARRPLAFAPLRSPEARVYREFDDVLLVVFFSHARYDVNLDYYRAVYAEYFPNVSPPRLSRTSDCDPDFFALACVDAVYRSWEPRGRGVQALV